MLNMFYIFFIFFLLKNKYKKVFNISYSKIYVSNNDMMVYAKSGVITVLKWSTIYQQLTATLTRNELTHLVNVFFCTASCWSASHTQNYYKTTWRCHKKLSYRRGTAQRAMLVNSCYVPRGTGVRKVSKSKTWPSSSFKVLAMVRCNLIGHIWFPISVQLQL